MLSSFVVCVKAADIDEAERLFEQRQYVKARDAFEKFAQHGHAKAQYYMGMMYYQGKGGPADIYQAYAWFSLSDENGFALPAKKFEECAVKYLPKFRPRKLLKSYQQNTVTQH